MQDSAASELEATLSELTALYEADECIGPISGSVENGSLEDEDNEILVVEDETTKKLRIRLDHILKAFEHSPNDGRWRKSITSKIGVFDFPMDNDPKSQPKFSKESTRSGRKKASTGGLSAILDRKRAASPLTAGRPDRKRRTFGAVPPPKAAASGATKTRAAAASVVKKGAQAQSKKVARQAQYSGQPRPARQTRGSGYDRPSDLASQREAARLRERERMRATSAVRRDRFSETANSSQGYTYTEPAQSDAYVSHYNSYSDSTPAVQTYYLPPSTGSQPQYLGDSLTTPPGLGGQQSASDGGQYSSSGGQYSSSGGQYNSSNQTRYPYY
eukprot:113785_1